MKFADGSRVALLVVLSTTCAAKLWSGHQPHFALSREVFIIATIVEIALVCGLLVRRLRAWASVGVGVLAAIGIVVEFFGRGRTCGCLGSVIRLTSAQHILLSATVGALAVVVWYCEVDERSSLTGQRS